MSKVTKYILEYNIHNCFAGMMNYCDALEKKIYSLYEVYYELYCDECNNESCKFELQKINNANQYQKDIIKNCAEFRKMVSILKGN
jgi:hypothetical protein